jgi:hypothetical protein
MLVYPNIEYLWFSVKRLVESPAAMILLSRLSFSSVVHGMNTVQLVSIQKWLICPISALREKFNPRNINHMPAVEFFVRLDLDQIILFLDGHQLELIPCLQVD